MTADLEPAIARLETAASIWFNQELHRDLQSLIAAARAAGRSENYWPRQPHPDKPQSLWTPGEAAWVAATQAGAAAFRSDPTPHSLASVLIDPPKSATDPRLDEKAKHDLKLTPGLDEMTGREEKPDDMLWTYVTVPNPEGLPYVFSGSVKHRRDLADIGEPYRQAIVDARALRRS